MPKYSIMVFTPRLNKQWTFWREIGEFQILQDSPVFPRNLPTLCKTLRAEHPDSQYKMVLITDVKED